LDLVSAKEFEATMLLTTESEFLCLKAIMLPALRMTAMEVMAKTVFKSH
jgi:hypothetical protein